MKKLLILSSLLLTFNAYADSIGILDCMSKEKGVTIEISRLDSARTKLDAQIGEDFVDGDTFYSNYEVKKQKRNSADEPLVYKGEDFELSLDVLSAKDMSDVKGHIKAVTNDRREFEEDVDCEIY